MHDEHADYMFNYFINEIKINANKINERDFDKKIIDIDDFLDLVLDCDKEISTTNKISKNNTSNLIDHLMINENNSHQQYMQRN